jgi:putative ABC transport system permease protein
MTRGDLRENILMAFDTLWQNKLRSFLTILGVVVGMMPLIVIAAFVSGINSRLSELRRALDREIAITGRNYRVIGALKKRELFLTPSEGPSVTRIRRPTSFTRRSVGSIRTQRLRNGDGRAGQGLASR